MYFTQKFKNIHPKYIFQSSYAFILLINLILPELSGWDSLQTQECWTNQLD